jgi:hypothetical protein
LAQSESEPVPMHGTVDAPYDLGGATPVERPADTLQTPQGEVLRDAVSKLQTTMQDTQNERKGLVNIHSTVYNVLTDGGYTAHELNTFISDVLEAAPKDGNTFLERYIDRIPVGEFRDAYFAMNDESGETSPLYKMIEKTITGSTDGVEDEVVPRIL